MRTTKDEQKQIADTILMQLIQHRNTGRLAAMLGASNFYFDENEQENVYVRFKFKGSRKFNTVRITLNAMDLYDVEYIKSSVVQYQLVDKVITKSEGLYADMLKSDFEQTTGLYLSL